MIPKEALEEAAENYANDWEEIHPELDSEDMTPIAVSKIDFIAGAKWQQERMYSEEEVLELLRKAHFVEQNIDEWFEQFKK